MNDSMLKNTKFLYDCLDQIKDSGHVDLEDQYARAEEEFDAIREAGTQINLGDMMGGK